MKTKILLCTLCLASFGLRAQDVAPLPEGRWTLTGTVIQKAIGADNRSNELYTPDVHANPLDCIYPVLNIEAGLCHMESNERKDEVTCTYNGRGELTLWYSAPVSFTYTFPSANTVSLVREYRKYDEEKDTSAIMSVRLTYTKD